MKSYSFPLLAAAVFATPAAAEVALDREGPVVNLTVTESVEARPDIAQIGAGVSTQAPTAVAAMQDNAAAMNSVIERIKSLGIAERDIQTAGISLSPDYEYDQENRRQVFRGYRVTNRVSATMRDIERIGPVLDALVAAGATDLSGPNWSVDDPTQARAQARERAVETARERAMEYARLTGYSDVRLLELGEAVPFDRPMPMADIRVTAQARESTPVEPGRVETGVTLTVSYELTR